MYGLVALNAETPERLEPQKIFRYEGDYLGVAVDFLCPLSHKNSLRVEIGNHINDEDDAPFDSDFFAFVGTLQTIFEAYLANHEHDGDYFEANDLCQDYHQEWARWLRDYADRLERLCLPYAFQHRRST